MLQLRPIDYVVLAIAAALLVVSVDLPRSRYAFGVRATCMLIPPALTANIVMFYVPGFFTREAETLLNVAMFSTITAIMLSELEFLRVLIPYVAAITPVAVERVQLAVCLTTVFMMGTAFSPYFPDTAQFGLKMIKFFVMAVFLISDLCQQCFLLHFVLVRLKGVTVGFKRIYTALIVAGFVVFLASVALTFLPTDSLPAIRFLRNMGIITLHVFSLVCMEILRLVLQRPRAAASPQQQRSRSMRAKLKAVKSVVARSPRIIGSSRKMLAAGSARSSCKAADQKDTAPGAIVSLADTVQDAESQLIACQTRADLK
ncbi:hypothetical protein BC831DRAFT_484712 [Entophlyctis helioformis]|nr:hypothetical protein BC831DRAFT_484712 [Entophlyctis helioformis]